MILLLQSLTPVGKNLTNVDFCEELTDLHRTIVVIINYYCYYYYHYYYSKNNFSTYQVALKQQSVCILPLFSSGSYFHVVSTKSTFKSLLQIQ